MDFVILNPTGIILGTIFIPFIFGLSILLFNADKLHTQLESMTDDEVFNDTLNHSGDVYQPYPFRAGE